MTTPEVEEPVIMSDAERFKRPDLERHEPVRRWTGVFGVPPGPHAPVNGPLPPNGESVGRGVDAGYRVLEDYLRQGQSFARTIAGTRPFGSAAVGGPQVLEQLARTTLDWFASWFDYMQAMGRVGSDAPVHSTPPREVGGFDIDGDRAPAPRTPPAPASSRTPTNGFAAHEAHAPLISIDVTSRQRTEVTLDLKPTPAATRLVAHALRAADPDLPRIEHVALEACTNDNRLFVRIAIPDAQPAAMYTGLIIDETTQLPRGTLAVRVFAFEG
jgi:hypothetical protein